MIANFTYLPFILWYTALFKLFAGWFFQGMCSYILFKGLTVAKLELNVLLRIHVLDQTIGNSDMFAHIFDSF